MPGSFLCVCAVRNGMILTMGHVFRDTKQFSVVIHELPSMKDKR